MMLGQNRYFDERLANLFIISLVVSYLLANQIIE
jgi:hypothetical protein